MATRFTFFSVSPVSAFLDSVTFRFFLIGVFFSGVTFTSILADMKYRKCSKCSKCSKCNKYGSV